MPAIPLTPAERRRLRADAHHLHPVVLIGAEGLTDAVRKEADAALNAHGLIKLRVFSDIRETREHILVCLSDELGAAAVQHIGKLLVLWRPVPEKPRETREDRLPGPRVVKLVSFSKSGNHRATVKKVKVLGNERVTPGGTIKRKEVRQVSPKKKAAD
jgi:putative YhbY family RNA-binding protein